MMAEASQNLKPIIQALGELYQGCRVDQHNRENRREMERVIDQLVAASRHADGCSHMATRAWIQDMDLAAERVDQAGIMEVVSRTTQGALRHAVEAFMHAAPEEREAVTWRDVQQDVIKHFLSPDEEAALRDVVEGQLIQEPHEAQNIYARRYQEVAQRAYPAARRNEDQQRLLVRYFLGGLRDREMARNVIRTHNPKTFEEAVEQVAELWAREEAFHRLLGPQHQHHTTMEVDAIQRDGNRLTKMEEAISALADAVAHITEDGDTRRYNWDEEGQPRCFKCGTWGHMRKDCLRKYTKEPRKKTITATEHYQLGN